MGNMPPLPISSINAFSEALYGKKGALDAWLEVNNEDEVRAHMKAYVDAHARVYAEQRVRPLESECAELRKILSQCTQALGTGAFASSACSLEFLRHIPEEIRKTVEMLRAALAAEQENANG